MATGSLTGWWEPVSEVDEITARQWAEMREAVRLATAEGKALVTAAGVSLVWHPAPDSLDAAWAEAEAALSERWNGPFVGPHIDGDFWASAWITSPPTVYGNHGAPSIGYPIITSFGEHGATPAAALRALAAKLREVPR